MNLFAIRLHPVYGNGMVEMFRGLRSYLGATVWARFKDRTHTFRPVAIHIALTITVSAQVGKPFCVALVCRTDRHHHVRLRLSGGKYLLRLFVLDRVRKKPSFISELRAVAMGVNCLV